MKFQKLNQSAFQNFLLAKYERFTGQVTNQSLPYFLLIDPSSVCQLRCPFCPTGIENEAKKEGHPIHLRNRTMMTPELFDSLIEELGENLFYVLFYNWGEPLFNKHLPEFIKKAKSYNIHTEIHTNLSFPFSDEQIENLLTSGIDEIDASIDGFSDQSYQTYRRGGNYNLAKSNLERMARIRERLGLKTTLIWNFLVFSFNEHEIDACRQYCDEIGIKFNSRDAFINVAEKPDWLPSYRKHELKSLNALPQPTDTLEKTDERIPETTNVEKPKVKGEPSCSWHYGVSVINADGAVSPCCVPWEDKFDFGDVIPERVTFKDIWNNGYFQKSRAAFAGKPVDQYQGIHSLCEACPYPPSIMNEYVPAEKEIINNFHLLDQFKDTELENAFSLLDREEEFVSYCAQNYDHLFNGDFEQIAAKGEKANMVERFTQFLRKL